MKHQLLIFMLIVFGIVICATSCNSIVTSSGVGQSGNETQNHEINDIYDQTLLFEQNTDDNTKVDSQFSTEKQKEYIPSFENSKAEVGNITVALEQDDAEDIAPELFLGIRIAVKNGKRNV